MVQLKPLNHVIPPPIKVKVVSGRKKSLSTSDPLVRSEKTVVDEQRENGKIYFRFTMGWAKTG